MAEATTPKSSAIVSVGAIFAALSGFSILIITARTLTAEDNAIFLAFWSTLFLITGILSGIQQEVTRAVANESLISRKEESVRPLILGISIGVLASLAFLAVSPLLSHVLETDYPAAFTSLLIACGLTLYAGQVSLLGVLGGNKNWNLFASITSCEALGRLTFITLVALTAATTLRFEIATVIAFALWLLFFLHPQVCRSSHFLVSVSWKKMTRQIGLALAASGATALLINGFPLLMALTTSLDEYKNSADLVMAVSITRAPLLVPIFAFQSVVIAHYVTHPEKRRSTTRTLFLGLSGFALCASPIVALIGPTIMHAVFGASYRSTGMILGILIVDATLLALLVLGGTITIALTNYKACLLGWYTTATVSFVLMLLPFSLEARTLSTLTFGPLLGIAIHFSTILRSDRERRI
ncbi:MATE family efflux transporter [Arcanobacterium haemolyticum]|uniref:Integral membrane protein n=1 Tax=Arcanobacterium haemolyticum (strain ATCC 9345 / DSM 20595 / CCM 5947 / CCUG 17215 / LMG 16163 / NBRC 15585 / NCTC 8452 / 11018) TaxID=644284 RepID=D7BLP4_ARCHD|nr:integral membrane protein [Arcanobacterium haemolyticum]ADH91843.1 putative integral membrane protein [Arcanobacterium haemolyticum DSM 20595]SQH27278.1 Uncharacterised protein [Arcanobacterium haemolyticum]